MKKTLLLLTLTLALISCSKNHEDVEKRYPNLQYFFSQVKFYKDGRTPSTDTVWTLRLIDDTMIESYRKQDDYLYEDATTHRTLGKFYSR